MSIKDITLGRYVYGSSFIHRLDPRTKLVSLLMLTTVLFSREGVEAVTVICLYTVIACFVSGLRPGYLLKSIMPFKWLILMTVLLNVLFVGGHIVVEAPLPFGGITREGMASGALYGGRIALLVLLASLLTLTTEPIVLVDGVEKLMKPLAKIGIRPHEVSMAMVITIRFIPILIDEAEKIRKSHVARGLDPEGGFIRKLKSVSLLFLPLFHSALRRAETLATAMECRIYSGNAERTRYSETIMRGNDWLVIAFSGATAVLVAVV